MSKQLSVSIGQYSTKGQKPVNQDFHGAVVPDEPQRTSKGLAVALADGISTSKVSQCASETVVTSFLSDYFCTPESWSVKTSAYRVIKSANSWLHAQTQNSPYRWDKEKGYVCTLAALILKSNTAHFFHCGDSRIYRVEGDNLEQLTEDHRHVLDSQSSYLTRAIGIHNHVDVDYQSQPLNVGDTFILATDGVYEFLNPKVLAKAVSAIDTADTGRFDALAKELVEQALSAGSDDNLTLQIVRVESLPDKHVNELQIQAGNLPPAPMLAPRMEFDGYTILRELYIGSRSHVFLAEDLSTQQRVVIKTPSLELRTNTDVLESFLMEDWIARRIDNAHVLKAHRANREQKYLYSVTEYIEGQTLTQWMRDNPRPSIDVVRDIIGQVARGLQAFHRQEMVHQDLRPNNIMIDAQGVVKIIDFGSTYVAGIAETNNRDMRILGTAQFTAPEYYLGEQGGARSDIFSLALIAYKMLSGDLPYGIAVSKTRSKRDQFKLRYKSLNLDENRVPDWVDYAIGKAAHIDPNKRYQEVAEFVYELGKPSVDYLAKTKPPLIERDPLKFWQGLSLILFCVVIYQSLN
jgi:serine/threonine protein phosphatase PrpC